MDNRAFSEMRSRVASLPVLEQRLNWRLNDIAAARCEAQDLLAQYEKESADVEHLKKESLSAALLKMVGRYEGRLEKETQEMLAMKIRYDKAVGRMKAFEAEKTSLEERIALLKREKSLAEAEAAAREKRILNDPDSENARKFLQLKEEEERVLRQLSENGEAARAADNAADAAKEAINELSDAEGWARWDVWGGGGIITHLAKYEHIDSAEESFHRLNALLSVLEKELKDVDLAGIGGFGINSLTRGVDFWLDNIFTDLHVLDKIGEDTGSLNKLLSDIADIKNRLENARTGMQARQKEIEKQKDELLASL
jgi:hypothetical protein